MQIKNILTFDKGLYINDGNEKKVIDSFLINLLNIDIDLQGKISRRWGYEYWDLLLNNNSEPSSDTFPKVSDDKYNRTNIGFNSQIQNIKSYTDVGGNKMIFVIVDGKLYSVTKDPTDGNKLVWSLLNKDNSFKEKVKVLKIVSYLDLVFINDAGTNVFYYDSQEYNDGGWLASKNFWIYFNGANIYYRKYADYSIDKIVDIQPLASGKDLRGNAVYDSLSNISYPNLASLDLGYAIKINDGIGGYNYYVLDKGSDTTSATCYLIKFNSRMIALNYVTITKKVLSEIMNFDYDGTNYIYMMSDDGKINKIDKDTLNNTVLTSGDIAGLTGFDIGGTTFYSLAINNNKIWVYSKTLPSKTDWYVPFPITEIKDTGKTATDDPGNTWDNYNSDKIQVQTKTDIREIVRTQSLNNILNINFNVKMGNYQPDPVLDNEETWNRYDGALTSTIDKYSGTYPMSEDFHGTHRTYYAKPYKKNTVIDRFKTHIYKGKFYCYISDTFKDIENNFNYGIIRNSISGILDNKVNYVVTDKTASGFSYIYPFDISFFLQPSIFEFDYINNRYDSKYTFLKSVKDSYYWFFGDYENWSRYFYKNYYDIEYLKKYDILQDSFFTMVKNPDFAYPHTTGEVNLFNSGTYTRADNTMLLKDSYFNTDYFASSTNSNYAMLVGLSLDDYTISGDNVQTIDEGSKFIPNIFFGIKITDMDHIYPLVSKGDNLYWGTAKTALKTDPGWLIKQNMKNYEYQKIDHSLVERVGNIYGSNDLFINNSTDIGIVEDKYLDNDYTISGDSVGFKASDYTLPHYYSLLSFEDLQITDSLGNVTSNKLKQLGCLNSPDVKLIVGSSTWSGETVEYGLILKFLDDSVTPLTNISEPVIAVDNTIEIELSNISLNNSKGVPMYNINDVHADGILIYRRTDGSSGGQFYQIGNIAKTSIGTITTFTDNYIANSSVFSANKVIKYPFNDMVVHKNRLVLINRLDYENSNVIFYSDVDLAHSIPTTNFRAIESGDGDELLTAISINEYLYLFKNRKIYAILGDVSDGQLIDINKTVGTKYPNLITHFNNFIFFINDYGVYTLVGNDLRDISIEKLNYLFDKNNDDSIDFNSLKDNGSVFVDIQKREIRWYLTRKENGNSVDKNNMVLIYDTMQSSFRIYEYSDNIVMENEIRDLTTDHPYSVLTDYSGNIYKTSKVINDNGNPIYWFFITKEFNIGTNLVKKRFKLIKVHGKFPNSLMVNYWIDGEKKVGEVMYRKLANGEVEGTITAWGKGIANSISVEVMGNDATEIPSSIDEILIGFEKLNKL